MRGRNERRRGVKGGRVAVCAFVVCCAVMPGCRLFDDGVVEGAGVLYPSGKEQLATADVQVTRDVTTIEMTNTSARSFERGRLWLNSYFSREIDGFGVGETLRLDLYDFVDEYGERFRAGGFFATDPPEDLVLVQYEEAGSTGLIGFVVVRGEGE